MNVYDSQRQKGVSDSHSVFSFQLCLWASAAGIGNRQPPERVKQHVNRAAWTLEHATRGVERGEETHRRGHSGIVAHSWTLGAALRSICSCELTPKKVVQLGPSGLCADCMWTACGLAIGALWLLTVNRGNQERECLECGKV